MTNFINPDVENLDQKPRPQSPFLDFSKTDGRSRTPNNFDLTSNGDNASLFEKLGATAPLENNKSQIEIVDEIAYKGIKDNNKLEQLSKLKADNDLKGCTFKPNLVARQLPRNR